LQYAVTDGVNVFASYSKGFKSGGLNSASFSGNNGNLEYGPESVNSYELGVKSTLFDRSLTFNATAFLGDFKDLQVLNIQGAAITVSNAATATSKGLEADLTWLTPWEWLSLKGSLGLLDARYDSYPDGPATVNMPRGSMQDLSGRPLTFAPDITASLSPTVRFLLPGSIAGQFSVDALYQSSQYTNLDLDPNTLVPAHVTFSARLILSSTTSGWSLIVGGTNLSDAKVANQIINTTIYPGVYAVTQQNGREISAALSYGW
jgi:outer membrane receptor protein involved in Fe transport